MEGYNKHLFLPSPRLVIQAVAIAKYVYESLFCF